MSSETPTRRMSELPPLRPLESVRTKIMLVPAATSAVQSKVVGPVGGLRINVSPPGIMPYIAQIGVDWSTEGKWRHVIMARDQTYSDRDRLLRPNVICKRKRSTARVSSLRRSPIMNINAKVSHLHC